MSFLGIDALGKFVYVKVKAMPKKKNIHVADASENSLKTEHPLCDKDQQMQGIDKILKMQKEALKLWRALKKKCK